VSVHIDDNKSADCAEKKGDLHKQTMSSRERQKEQDDKRRKFLKEILL
jgi:hypothetical protein